MPLIYANEAFTRITGYSLDETLGKNCRFLQVPLAPRPLCAPLDCLTAAQISRTGAQGFHRRDKLLCLGCMLS